jgi:acetylornithine deacetylase/succinyl-diaminopimelate desuccinylase-like protein
MRSGEIGPGKAGGLRRLALSDADKEMRDLLVTWCTEAGCTVDILSQAGHDAYYVSRIAPTAMIFTPCRDGISHNEAEHAELDSTSPGVDVLLHAVLARANR